MARSPMVHVATAPNAVHARIIAARLGSEGIVWTLRGEDSIYPCGAVDVLVSAEDAGRASELLLADEVESAFGDDDTLDAGRDAGGALGPVAPVRATTWLLVAVALAILVSLTVSRVVMTSEAARPAGTPTDVQP
ncbi:MAG: hypothetical protein S0880_29875 [Actinomycetota bacterium]|nr:hypothetical protein [Actinomycetota bacterium]